MSGKHRPGAGRAAHSGIDEIEQDRRSERRLWWYAAVALVAVALVIIVREMQFV